MTAARELDDLRWINDALADGEERIKKQREIIADLGLLGADSTRAKTVLDAMLSAQAERQRYREMLLREHHCLEWFAVCLALLWPVKGAKMRFVMLHASRRDAIRRGCSLR